MPKIRLKLFIDQPGEYQKGVLPENAVKLKMPENAGKTMSKTLPFGIAIAAVLLSCLMAKRFIHNYQVINPIFLIVGLVGGFLLLWVHELLHAVVYPKGASVIIGFCPKFFAFMALGSYPMKRNRFIFMCLLPFVLGIVPLLCFILFPYTWVEWNSVLFGLAVMGMISPYPDCYNVYQVLKQAPKGSEIQFYGDDTYYIVREDSPVGEEESRE